MNQEAKFNIPNVLSAYRLFAIPFILAAIWYQQRQIFVALLCINLITDILDGYIARRFKLETEFGARLDSLADIGTYLLAVLGLLRFEKDFMATHTIAFTVLFTLYALGVLIPLVRFKRTPSLHLYSVKVSGYLQGIFLVTFFTLGYWAFYFYFMITVSCLAYLEEIILVSTVTTLRSNMRSLFFVLKSKRTQP